MESLAFFDKVMHYLYGFYEWVNAQPDYARIVIEISLILAFTILSLFAVFIVLKFFLIMIRQYENE